jgi:hypothetical protein
MMRYVVLVALALIGFAAASARADDPANEAVWKQYWMAIDAQKQCNNVAFSQAQYDAMVHVINQKIRFDLGAGIRHDLMSDASSEVSDLTFKYGCKSPQVMDLLALYNRDLAPVVL